MKQAIIVTGGKQYLVAKDDVISIEKLPGNPEVGSEVIFDEVLLVDDGKATQLGAPTVKATVKAQVVENGKQKKVLVVKYKAKSRYYKKRGHKQPYTKVVITSI